MDELTKYMIRQHFLNQLIPPHPSHKIMGSNFLYDLFQGYVWCKAKDYARYKAENPIEVEIIRQFQIYQREERMKEWNDKCYYVASIVKKWLFDFANKEIHNPLLKLIQLVVWLLIGIFAIFEKTLKWELKIIFKLLGKGTNLSNQKQDD